MTPGRIRGSRLRCSFKVATGLPCFPFCPGALEAAQMLTGFLIRNSILLNEGLVLTPDPFALSCGFVYDGGHYRGGRYEGLLSRPLL